MARRSWRSRPADRTGDRRFLAAIPVLLLLLLLLVSFAAASAGGPADPAPSPPPSAELTAAEEKVSTDLLALADHRFLLPNQSRADVESALSRGGHFVKAGRTNRAVGTPSMDLVQVYVILEEDASPAAVRRVVHRVQGEDTGAGIVAGWVAPARLLDLARLPEVREVRPVQKPDLREGSVTSAGDIILDAASLREATGLSGAGVRVGVISDGVDHWQTARALGDLPPGLTVLRNGVGGDEGTAMLEVVHDLAPNASLVFHDCGWNVIEFTGAIDELVEAGCTVIVDDIGWTDEPFFQDGTVAGHVAGLVERGEVVYVSAAGNDAQRHYQGDFQDDGTGWHDFSGPANTSQNRLYVDIPVGDAVTVVLQWNEPFGEAGSNYDLALYDTSDLSTPLAAATREQDGNDDPIEVLTWYNSAGATVRAEVDVLKRDGARACTLEVFVYPRGSATLIPLNTVPGDSVYGHPAVEGVIATAAIDAGDPAAERVEPYSSRGPVTVIAPEAGTRQKPDCAGVDAVRVTGAGSFGTVFRGTSAAAPHTAGIAALVWSGRQDAGADLVRAALLAGADDLGAAGADPAYGAGRLNATAAHASLVAAPGAPSPVPGRIEAEDYDVGGEGVAYHDTTPGNDGNVYRFDDVDIEPLPDGSGYNVGWIREGEWLGYTVDVATGGTYFVEVRAASRWGHPSLTLIVDGTPAATVPIAETLSYDVFGLTNTTVPLEAGVHELRLLLSGYFNLDYLEFSLADRVLRLPGAGDDPRDHDDDGLCEDMNGNGRLDFEDVVLFFNQMAWVAENEPLEAFDFNANGRIDFADVTALFMLL